MITIDRHDPLADAFDRFTSEAADEIIAPGASAARRTAARRRRRHGAAVLAVAAAAVIAGTVILPGHLGRGSTAAPSISPLTPQLDSAAIAVAVLDGGEGSQFHGTGTDPVTLPDVPNGYYELTFDCVGTGTVNATLSFTPPGGDGATSTNEGPQPCTADPVGYRVPLYKLVIEVNGPGEVGITFDRGTRAAVAWRLDWVHR